MRKTLMSRREPDFEESPDPSLSKVVLIAHELLSVAKRWHETMPGRSHATYI